MFAPSPKSISPRRNKPYTRNKQHMSRSGSILGTIRNIVAAPLAWFAANENFEDLGKRRRNERDACQGTDGNGDEEDDAVQSPHKVKRMRVDSPERVHHAPPAAGYLDPPPVSLQPTQPTARRGGSLSRRPRADENVYGRRSIVSMYGAPPLSHSRTMSIDPPAQYATIYHDPAAVPLPLTSPVASNHSLSLGPRDGSIQLPSSHFRLRTSLTPQPSIANPLRREPSMPPPSSALQSKPMFVRPPQEDASARQLRAQKTLSLGTLAEFDRATRSPSRDRMLTSFGSFSSIPSQMSTSSNATAQAQNSAAKTYHDLELYKSPIMPSRYKDAKVIPDFLKPKRVHVPIPMSKKGREVRPSLGMAGKSKGKGRDRGEDDGKPYARKGGLSKLLARRRKADEEEGQQDHAGLNTGDNEENIEKAGASGRKRDVGVYAHMTSGSEDEPGQKKKTGPAPGPTPNDPFARSSAARAQVERNQPYGRVGRTRTREAGLRSVPLKRTSNKFSAAFDDEESEDADEKAMMDDGEGRKASPKEAEAKKPVFDAPAGFSFATTTSIQHDHTRAKEPPIMSLPFSLGKSAEKMTPKPFQSAAAPTGAPSLIKPPASAFPAAKAAPAEGAPVLPKLSVVPPTPVPPVPARQETSAPSNFSAPAPAALSTTSVPPAIPNFFANSHSAGSTPVTPTVPNFFANSALLAGKKPAAPSPVPAASGSSPPVPVKDPENPLWNGEAPPATQNGNSSQPAESKSTLFSFAQKPAATAGSTSPLPSPLFGAPAKKPEASAGNRPASVHLFGGQDTPAAAAPSSFSPTGTGSSTSAAFSFGSAPKVASEKPAEPESKPSAPPSFFAFGATAGASAPKPLFGTGAATSSGTSFPSSATQPAQPAQNTTTSTTEQKPSFSFGAPPVVASISNPPTSSTDSPTVPKPLFGNTGGSGFSFGAPPAPAATTSNADTAKNPFGFGAPPATPPSGTERKGSPFTFGAPAAPSSGGSTGFGFGAPAKAPENNAAAPAASQFAFSAPAARSVTPPSKADEGMSMEESPTRMDMNGTGQNKPAGGMTFGLGATPVNPFGQPNSSSSMFPFGGQPSGTSSTSHPFGAKEESKPTASGNGFNFNRTASAPTISTTFSFGQKSEGGTPPATAFGAPSNAFGQPAPPSGGSLAAPFGFGQPPNGSNSFGAPAPAAAAASTPSSPFTSGPSFAFNAPSGTPGNQFSFGASQPSSPAGAAAGLPQSPASATTPFAFGQSTGGTVFNIGAAPPSTTSGTGTPKRQMKGLPRRGPGAKR
ncbi:hypothetical protein DFH11DRAFT_1092365 [Phellopilus nigrolimitatus]|nr:hypothetical protein DFH11DRAFT_1092365 [Phellopilus nigrolimitatus]